MNKLITMAALLTSMLYAVNANAEEPEDKSSKVSNVETLIVIGKRDNLTVDNLAGSLDYISQDELAYEHVDDTLELFSKVPGVYLSRYNQGIINTDIAIRGFAGDGVTPHGKLLIDGIPANLHNGYNELDQLFPFSIESITVFKGTSDPRYGIFDVAGNYNVNTRQDQAKELELTLGSFNTKELQGYAGLYGGNFHQNYAVGYRSSEGYRDHTDLDKYALAGSWEWQLDNGQAFRIIARHAGYEGDSPGYFSSTDEAQENPDGSTSFSSLDGGDKNTSHLSLHWSQELDSDIEWQLKAYSQNFERERWVRFSEAGSLTNRYDDQEQWGIISTFSWTMRDNWTFDWGADYEYQDVLEQRFSTIEGTRLRDSATRNRAYDFANYGAYLQLVHEPSESLRWNIGIRADRLNGDFQDQLSDTSREMYNFGTIIQPTLNIVYAFSSQINAFANAGRSFQHPFGASTYTSGDRNSKDVSVNDGWEIGTQWSPSRATDLRVSFWEQKASDEFISLDGTSQNVGETNRNGFDIAFNGTLSDSWSLWGNFTTIDSEIVRAGDAIFDAQGNELRSIPSFIASVGINYQVTESLVARVHFDAQDDYYINEANVGGKFGGYSLLSASVDYDAGWGTIKFQLNNITDEYYEYAFDFANDAEFTIHSPGDGINGSMSVNWRL